MAAGTAAALVPIQSITMKSKNDTFTYLKGSEEPGPICLQLLSTLKGIQQGKIKDTFGWLDHVEEAQGYWSRDGTTEQSNGLADAKNVGSLV
jgi:branched-chain amino acid aminotransferase